MCTCTVHGAISTNMLEGLPQTFADVQYLDSFPLDHCDSRTDFVKGKLRLMKDSSNKNPVLLIVSIGGIKVYSPDGKILYMAHALKRISYATCDPDQLLFSFLAREPHGHFSFQHCHSFITSTAAQAEELNSIVGNAFRMAYAAQLQKPPTTIQDVIASQLDQTQTDKVLWTKELSTALIRKDKPPTTTILNNTNLSNTNTNTTMDVQLTTNPSTDSPTLRLSPPSSIPGLKPTHKYNVLGPSPETEEDNNRSHQDDLIMNHQHHHHHSLSQQSTPSSDESNSPTEMNSYRRMTEKPPLIKRLAMGFSVVNQNSNNTSNNQGQVEYDDSLPLVNNRESSVTSSTPSSPTNRPLSGGYVNESITDNSDSRNKNLDLIKNDIVSLGKQIPLMDNTSTLEDSADPDFTKTKRISQISSNSSASSGQCPTTTTTTTTSSTETTTTTRLLTSGFSSLPQVPERTDSLNNREEGELRLAPWFQAGIPREIALEVLAQEPVGAFMVRESTSKPGCFALSLRVPRNFQPTGIAHYLIVATTKGYKIKGFTKEFTTLTSLITHHSVMPELLPCPLSLSRYNPSFVRTDSKRDFADIDLDPDYNTLADFRKMMADLNI